MPRSVLLVEPDLDALGDLASKLRSRGLKVAIADSRDSALERARKSPPDVFLVSESIASGAEPRAWLGDDTQLDGIPVFVLADDESGEHTLSRADASQIAKRIYALATEAPSEQVERGDFRGALEQVSVVDLLQLLSMNRRTGVLSINTPSGVGELRLGEGEIVDAVYRRLEGEKAIYRLLAETEGSFAFTSRATAPLQRVKTPTRVLLMEGLRRVDEVRERRQRIAGDQDALLASGTVVDPDSEAQRRVAEMLTVPRTLDEVLDEVPLGDLELLDAISALLGAGEVRKVARGAVRAELADEEHVTVLAAQVERLARAGFCGPVRLVVAGPPKRLSTVGHAVRRIKDAQSPAETVPAAPVPHSLATLPIGDSVELEIMAVPTIDAYSPLWGMALPGSIVALRLPGCDSEVFARACAELEVPLADAEELVGDLDDADPAQMAILLRSALDTVTGG